MASIKRFTKRMKCHQRSVRYLGLPGARAIGGYFFTRKPSEIRVHSKALGGDINLRVPSSDVTVYRQIIGHGGYDLPYQFTPKTIVDLGSNIGLSVRYFAHRFPEAKIICVEADPENIPLLRKNVQGTGAIVHHNAAWSGAGHTLAFTKPVGDFWGGTASPGNAPGTPPGTADASNGLHDLQTVEVASIGLAELIAEHGLEQIDILKVDIEGAELELFRDCGDWVGRVRCAMVETHDYNAPGALATTIAAFPDKQHKLVGENEMFWDEGMFAGL